MKATPPFITPFAILSVILLLGTTNVVENHVTHTHEGGPVQQPARVVNNNQNPGSGSVRSSVSSTGRQTGHLGSSSRATSSSGSAGSGSGRKLSSAVRSRSTSSSSGPTTTKSRPSQSNNHSTSNQVISRK